METITGYKNIIIAVLAALLAFYIYSLKSNIKSLEIKNEKLNSELVQEKSNNLTLKGEILTQNKQIEKQKVDILGKMEELEAWKNKPAEIRYKNVIKKIEVKSNECKDIKSVINDIRNTGF